MSTEWQCDRLQIFDGGQELANRAADDQSFALFPQLPADLRFQIWRTSLQRERMIQVCIHPVITDDGPRPQQLCCFRVAVRGLRVLSKLLRVNHEARCTALSFYRVQIPCTFTRQHPSTDKAALMDMAHDVDMLYFNPEYDILQFSASQLLHYTQSIPHAFLLDLRARDPRNIGLRSLALEVDTWDRLPHVQYQYQETATTRQALNSLFAGLHEVLLISTTSVGRFLVTAQSRQDGCSRTVLLLHSTLPIRTYATPTFSRQTLDPRPSAPVDMSRIFTGDKYQGPHGKRQAAAQAMFARLLGAGGAPSARWSWLLALSPPEGEIRGREAADAFLRNEKARWTGENALWSGEGLGVDLPRQLETMVWRYLGGDAASVRIEDLGATADVAFGYWLFPLDGHDEDKGADEWEFLSDWLTRPLYDFSKCSPELLLMELA